MWPFKQKEEKPAPVVFAPCGMSAEHNYWTNKGWACPACAAESKARREQNEKDAQAENIARRVVRLLNEQSAGEKP